MFEICRAYLVDVLKNRVGITNVSFTKGQASGAREARVFSMPTRGSVAQDFTKQQETIRYYTDPHDKYPARFSGTTDATGNTGTTVKCDTGNFLVNGVVIDDYYIENVSNRRSKVVSVPTGGKTLVITDAIAANGVAFRVAPKDGKPRERRRQLKANEKITFVVEFTNTNLTAANADFRNFIRNVGKFIYDGQIAYILDGVTVEADTRGNKIKVNLGPVEWGDNQYFPELNNKILVEVEFEGGIFVVPDPFTGAIELDQDWVSPETSLSIGN
jgi:hypothetical protein